ncbi:MAG TPA: type II secretion system protein [Candidatus Paceibacterota bacterium]|nr:type II secretion system protein [Candidatus Paceibacterota bacterium]
MVRETRGFTIVELLVTIGVIVFIATVTLVYNRAGEKQVALSVESAKVAGLILQAKQLAIAAYSLDAGLTCGYGVYFDQVKQQYSLFAYSPKGSATCPSLATIETSSTWQWSTNDMLEYSGLSWQIPVTTGLVLATGTISMPALDTVLFYPPNPTTVMVQDGSVHFETTSTLYVHLTTDDKAASSTISVNPAGQVNF